MAASILVRRLLPPDTAHASGPLFELVSRFATSFVPERSSFETSLQAVLADESAWLGVAVEAGAIVGYCLGFDHPTFYANGSVAWVEEIMVREDRHRSGVGRILMDAFEQWASDRGDRLVGLATRRAATFYSGLGYEESATFFRKLLPPGVGSVRRP